MIPEKQKYDLFLKEIADNYLDAFERQGHANPGHNGPYGHIDTPARNTAHWCITYGHLWKVFGDPRYREISRRFADYLTTLQEESLSGAVKCMEDETYNHMNGLVGQAWCIEALVYFYEISGVPEYLDCAARIFMVPQYREDWHMWEMVELDGRCIGLDYTFNHQLWFAAAGSMILRQRESPVIRDRITDYLDGCRTHLLVHRDGLIRHCGDLTLSYGPASDLKKWVKRTAKKTLFRHRRHIDPNRYDADGYERAYHLFNLYAFAILKRDFGFHPIYSSKALLAALDYGRRTGLHNDFFNVENLIHGRPGAIMNDYAYAYNSPAFEYPYVYRVFGDRDFSGKCEHLFELQLASTYDETAKQFSRNNSDPETLTARCCELVPFLEYEETETP